MNNVKANELRIGNWFRFHKDSPMPFDEYEALEIYSDGVRYLGKDFKSLYCYIEGIPLTDEWFVKFGFEKSKEYYDFEGFKVFWADHDGIKTFYHINSDTVTHFDHVHHLQNYVFFMTLLDGEGTELTIKEK